MNPLPQKELLTVDQAAWILKLHPQTVYRLVKRHQIPYVRLTGLKAIRFDWTQIERWYLQKN